MKNLETRIKEDLKNCGEDWDSQPEEVKELIRMVYSGGLKFSNLIKGMMLIKSKILKGGKK